MTPESVARVTDDGSAFRLRFARMIRVISLAVGVLFSAGLLLWSIGLLPLPVWQVTTVIGVLVVGNPLATRAVRTTHHPKELFYLCQVFWTLIPTFTIHYLGGIEFPAGALFYVLVVVNAGILVSGAACYRFANLSALIYGGLLYLEHAGVLTHYSPFGYSVPGRAQAIFGVGTWIALNLIAAYTDNTTSLLEERRRRLADAHAALDSYRLTLEDRVQERTRELQTANRALEEKQEELRDFVYTVTHDLKTPLSSILLTADALLEEEALALSDEGRGYLTRVIRAAERGEEMIRDLLQLFRITSAGEEAGWVDLRRLTLAAIDELHAQIDAKRVRVSVGDLPRVWGQGRKLAHVITNLLENAVKYVPSGTGSIEVSGRVAGERAIVQVRDNGIGIDPAYQHRIFDLFGRVPAPEQMVDGRAAGGTGVGLAIVKRVVERHGGQVRLESSTGAGSCFTVELPAAPTE